MTNIETIPVYLKNYGFEQILDKYILTYLRVRIMIERKDAFSHGNNRKTRNVFMYTVLLADDEPAVLDALTAGIPWAQLGVDKILTAADGIQALDVLASSHADLLITDIMMPCSSLRRSVANIPKSTASFYLLTVNLSMPKKHCSWAWKTTC